MFVNNTQPTWNTYPAAAGGQAQTPPPAQGFFARMKDKFESMGLGGGFGGVSKEIKQAFKACDRNKDNSLDAVEFGSVGAAFAIGTNQFAAADKNGNLKVSLGEFKQWIRGVVSTEFRQLDTNNDKKIDVNEFRAMAARNPGLQMQGIDTSGDGAISLKEYLRFRVATLSHH